MRLRQRRHRHVRAHRADRLGGVFGHREDDIPQVFPRIPEGAAQPRALFGAARLRLPGPLRQVFQADQLLHPFAVGVLPGVEALQLFTFTHFSAGEVRLQHVAAGQLPPAHDMRVFLRQHACLGGKDQPPVIRQRAAQRAQAVPVQGRAHALAVGVQDGRRAVPGFHHRGIVAVEIPPRGFLPLVLPGLRQQDHARQGKRESVHCQEFQGIVQHLAVASAVRNHRKHPAHFPAHHGGAHGFLAGLHAVMVAADRVDFPVVQQHPLGMRLAPARECVGREPGVHHGHPARIAHVLQVVIKGTKLVHQHHSLVDNSPCAQGADICIRILFFKRPPQDVEMPFKVRAGGNPRRTAHKALPDPRHGPPRAGAQLGRVAGHVAPAGGRDSFRRRQLLKDRAGFLHAGFILRQEEHADAVVAGLSQRDTFLLRPRSEQRVRELRHDADAVPGRSGRVAAGTVGQALHDGERLLHGAVRVFTFQVCHGAHAAAVVLQFFPVQRKLPVPHGCFRLPASAESESNCDLFQSRAGIIPGSG